MLRQFQHLHAIGMLYRWGIPDGTYMTSLVRGVCSISARIPSTWYPVRILPYFLNDFSFIFWICIIVSFLIRMFSVKTMITASFYLIDLLFIHTTALFCLFYICSDEWDDSVFLRRYSLGSIPYFFWNAFAKALLLGNPWWKATSLTVCSVRLSSVNAYSTRTPCR